jgi:hypothetical protein
MVENHLVVPAFGTRALSFVLLKRMRRDGRNNPAIALSQFQLKKIQALR